jgi:ABC-type spermidine/putrescine transport system permease subunit II
MRIGSKLDQRKTEMKSYQYSSMQIIFLYNPVLVQLIMTLSCGKQKKNNYQKLCETNNKDTLEKNQQMGYNLRASRALIEVCVVAAALATVVGGETSSSGTIISISVQALSLLSSIGLGLGRSRASAVQSSKS